MMDAAAVLARFDAFRADPPPEPGFDRIWADGVWRTLGPSNFIIWWDFPAEAAAAIATREAAFFAGRQLEWKVYSHDRPPGLEAALAAAGFEADEPETFVALDLEATPLADPEVGVDIRAVTDAAGLADFLAVNEAAFGRVEPWMAQYIEDRLANADLAVFVAYDGMRPVASGRLELAPGTAFAGLFGGGVVPDYRGRGAYRALVAARAAMARRLGYRYLTVDARETSRPILQRLGFEALAIVCGWTLGGG